MPDIVPIRFDQLPPTATARPKLDAIVPVMQDGVTARTTVQLLGEALNGTTEVMFLGTHAQAASATIPTNVLTLMRLGYYTSGDGGEALFRRAATQPTHNGKFQSADGAWWELAPGQQITPKMFGAPTNNNDDDVPAIQAAHNYIESRPPGLVAGRRAGGYIHCRGLEYIFRTKLTINPTRVGIDGEGAHFNCVHLPNVNPADMPQLLTNTTGSSSSNWTQGTIGLIPWAFGPQGFKLDPTSEVGSFGIIGQKIPSTAGAKIEVTVVVARNLNMGTQRYITFSLRNGNQLGSDGGPGYGAGRSYTFRTEIAEGDAPQTVTFTLPMPSGNYGIGPWLTMQSNNLVTITSITCRALPDNTAILVRTPSANAGEQFGHTPFQLRAFKLTAPGSNASGWGYRMGMEFDTEQTLFSTRVQVYNVEVRGFYQALMFGTRFYISQFYSCGIYGNWDSISTRTSTEDAGENIVFYGCTISAANRGIFNPDGMNLRFNNCSIDYLPIVYEGGGLCVIDGGWIEKRFNNTLNLPFNVAARGRPWFDIYQNGSVYIIGTTLMQATEATENDDPQEEYLFYGANKFSRVELEIQGFNLRTASDAWMGGQGSIHVYRSRSGQGNKKFSFIPKRDFYHDLMAGVGKIRAGRTALDFPGWLVAEGGTSAYSASVSVTYAGTGNAAMGSRMATRQALPGNWTVRMTSAGGVGAAFQVLDPTGRQVGTGVIGTRYQGAIEFNIVPLGSGAIGHAIGDTWTVAVGRDYGRSIVGFAESPRRVIWTLGALVDSTLSASVDDPVTGCLALTKTGVGNGYGAFRMLLNAQHDLQHTVYFKTKVPGLGGAAGTSRSVFYNVRFVRVHGTDLDGIPQFDETRVVEFSAATLVIDQATGTDSMGTGGWVSYRLSSTYTDESTQDANNSYCPRWATHILLTVNHGALAANSTVYIDDIEVYAL